MYINSITPPPEVQTAIDDHSRLAVLGDLDKLVKMKAAMAIEKSAQAHSGAATGLDMGIAMMMPGIFSDALKTANAPEGQFIWNVPHAGIPFRTIPDFALTAAII